MGVVSGGTVKQIRQWESKAADRNASLRCQPEAGVNGYRSGLDLKGLTNRECPKAALG